MLKRFIEWKLETFGRFLTATDGYKSYFAAGLMVLYAVVGLVFNFHEADKAAEVIMAALALMGIAHKADKIIGNTY